MLFEACLVNVKIDFLNTFMDENLRILTNSYRKDRTILTLTTKELLGLLKDKLLKIKKLKIFATMLRSKSCHPFWF